jgi:chitinase
MKVEALVTMLLEIGEDGHALFPPEMRRDNPAGLDMESMADMADSALEHQIENLAQRSKKFAQKDEMIKMLYHLRDDAEFRAEVGRLMLREFRKEFTSLAFGDAAEID